ncbi:MAG: hypothetical protein RI965_1010 [Bacteroidota bacterium]|jgi:Coenzyme PQQ synthesis protein D (PqqD)
MKKLIKNNLLDGVKVHDEIFMVDLEADKYYALNPSAAYIWDLIYMPVSVEELKQKILQRYNVDENIATNALENILQEMIKRKMIIECIEE